MEELKLRDFERHAARSWVTFSVNAGFHTVSTRFFHLVRFLWTGVISQASVEPAEQFQRRWSKQRLQWKQCVRCFVSKIVFGRKRSPAAVRMSSLWHLIGQPSRSVSDHSDSIGPSHWVVLVSTEVLVFPENEIQRHPVFGHCRTDYSLFT